MSDNETWLREAQARFRGIGDKLAAIEPYVSHHEDCKLYKRIGPKEEECTCGLYQLMMAGVFDRQPPEAAASRTDLPRALARIRELERLLRDVATAAMRYDAAIYQEAGSTAAQQEWVEVGYENPVLVGSYDLDALYFEWLEKSRQALATLKENVNPPDNQQPPTAAALTEMEVGE